MRRRNPEPDSTEVSAFEHVLIDPMNNDEEEDKDRQFVTALARGLELLRCFTPSESVLGNQELARKTGHGFYQYENGQLINGPQPQPVPTVQQQPPVWIATENSEDYERLSALVINLGAHLEHAAQPSPEALCLLAPYGRDATSACVRFDTDPARTLCIDLLTDLSRHRTLMQNPLTSPAMRDAAHALLASDGVGVTVIGDSVGFVAQRTLAMVVNLACDIAQQRIASVEDIDQAVQLGLGYPKGPLAWGDALGPRRILTILQRMSELTHDPRYRPSPWLRRRAMLGVSLRHEEPTAG